MATLGDRLIQIRSERRQTLRAVAGGTGLAESFLSKLEHDKVNISVTNLKKLVDVLPKLNITNDPELERLGSQVRASLLVDPKELRLSECVRAETAKAAAEIAQRMAGYMSGYFAPAVNSAEVA